MNKILLFVQILVFLAFSSAFAGQKQPQSLKANRIENKAKPKIDGLLEEDAWKSNPQFFSGNFIQNRPKNGAEASQKTEIQIIYDDFAIYIAARLYDTHPDSILHEIGQRDGFDLNTDMFSVSFDTYNKQPVNSGLLKLFPFIFLYLSAGLYATPIFFNSGSKST